MLWIWRLKKGICANLNIKLILKLTGAKLDNLLNNILNFVCEDGEIRILSYIKGQVYNFSVACDLTNKEFCAKDFENCIELAFAKYIVRKQKGVIKYSLSNKNILIFEFNILS